MFFESMGPYHILVTNIDKSCAALGKAASSKGLIKSSHSRGTHELTHRNLKEFGSERLPFMHFHQNAAFYGFMVLAHFAYTCFIEDCLKPVGFTWILGVYAGSVRRRFIDFAAKIVKTGRRIIIKTTDAVMKSLKLVEVWRLCNAPAMRL